MDARVFSYGLRWAKILLLVIGIPVYIIVVWVVGILAMSIFMQLPAIGKYFLVLAIIILSVLFLIKKKYVIFAFLIPVPIVLMAASLYLFDQAMCGYKHSEKLVSESGKYSVEVIEQNCGATTPFVTNVMLRREKGKSLLFWENRISVYSATTTLSNVKAEWTGSNILLVKTGNCEQDYTQGKVIQTWNDVQIMRCY